MQRDGTKLLTKNNENLLKYRKRMTRLHLIQRFNQIEWEESNIE